MITLRDEQTLSRRPPWYLIAATTAAVLLLLLFWAGHAVMQGRGASLDRAIILLLRVPGHPEQPIGPAWLASAVRDVTALGSTTVLSLVTAAATCFLMLRERWKTAALVVAATCLGALSITIVKVLIARPRPDIVAHLMAELSHSFPSGHAANSAIVYLTLASLFFPIVDERRIRAFLLLAAMLLVLMIGMSRVYLGVHWPSDVLAGWAFGTVWALLWWRIDIHRWRLLGCDPCAPDRDTVRTPGRGAVSQTPRRAGRLRAPGRCPDGARRARCHLRFTQRA